MRIETTASIMQYQFECDLCLKETGLSTRYSNLCECPFCEKHICSKHISGYTDLALVMLNELYGTDNCEAPSFCCTKCSKLFRESFERQLRNKVAEVRKFYDRLILTWKYLAEQE